MNEFARKRKRYAMFMEENIIVEEGNLLQKHLVIE